MRARANALLWLLGIVITVAAFVVAMRGVEQNDRLVADLVRVPAGCATTVNVSASGTYFVYVETKGRVDSIDGCDNDSRSYNTDSAPDVDVTILDRAGDVVEQTSDDTVSYSTPSGVGRSISSFEAAEPGRYVIEVRSATQSAVVTVGVDAAVEKNRLVLIAVVGVLVGLLMMAVALIATVRRRRRPTTTGPVVMYGSGSDEPSLTWAPPRPEDRAPRS
ncbi:unannotated protein [freshwater metagenome]|uniref:Unannotated protein n=1 Tax=freshwater metagenome TaxID=449393 RepID=A0A6J6E712_9ZZZZ|nr:hypothetical protein [Actinomycetota bacterium]